MNNKSSIIIAINVVKVEENDDLQTDISHIEWYKVVETLTLGALKNFSISIH